MTIPSAPTPNTRLRWLKTSVSPISTIAEHSPVNISKYPTTDNSIELRFELLGATLPSRALTTLVISTEAKSAQIANRRTRPSHPLAITSTQSNTKNEYRPMPIQMFSMIALPIPGATNADAIPTRDLLLSIILPLKRFGRANYSLGCLFLIDCLARSDQLSRASAAVVSAI
jgi:hypothetical protein